MAVRNHGKTFRAGDHIEANKVQLNNRLTVLLSGSFQDDLTSLDESRLDEALMKLFGLATDTGAEAPAAREEHPVHMSPPVTPLFQQSVRYSAHANFNGRRASS